MTLAHHINQAIKAYGVMQRDIDYVVKDGEVIIVDEFTGRLMIGRRYNEGLHQAIEAKEGVKVADESKTLATITFQNYFRMYKKLAGMTGTAKTEDNEFTEIYGLDVVAVPTNRPMHPQGLPGRRVQDRQRQSTTRSLSRSWSAISQWPAGAGGYRQRGEERDAGQDAQALGIRHFNVLNAKNHEK